MDKIEISGGKVTASAVGKGASVVGGTVIRTAGGAAIGSGCKSDPDVEVSCGEISITGREITAEGNIGYGEREKAYSDGRLVGSETITGTAELKNQKKTTTCTVSGASAVIELNYYAESALTGKQTVKVTVGEYTYQTEVDFQAGKTDYTEQIGEPLYAAQLRIYTDWEWAERVQKVLSLKVIREGRELASENGEYYGAAATEGYSSGDDRYLYISLYLPAGEQYEISTEVENVCGGGLLSASGWTVQSGEDNAMGILPLTVSLVDEDEEDNLAEVTVSGLKGAAVHYLISAEELTDGEILAKLEAGEPASFTLTDGTKTFSAAAEAENTQVTCYVIAENKGFYSSVYRMKSAEGGGRRQAAAAEGRKPDPDGQRGNRKYDRR